MSVFGPKVAPAEAPVGAAVPVSPDPDTACLSAETLAKTVARRATIMSVFGPKVAPAEAPVGAAVPVSPDPNVCLSARTVATSARRKKNFVHHPVVT